MWHRQVMSAMSRRSHFPFHGRETAAQTGKVTVCKKGVPDPWNPHPTRPPGFPTGNCPSWRGMGVPVPRVGGIWLLRGRGVSPGPPAGSLPSLKKLCWEGRAMTKLGMLAVAGWGTDRREGGRDGGGRLAQPWAGLGDSRPALDRQWGCSLGNQDGWECLVGREEGCSQNGDRGGVVWSAVGVPLGHVEQEESLGC